MSIVETKTERIEVMTPGCREKFENWIQYRGGVQVWKNQNLSNPNAGDMFTAALTIEGQPTPCPHWSRAAGELVKEIGGFRFVKELKEVQRCRIALRMGDSGLTIKLTDASSRRVRAICAEIKARTGEDPTFSWGGDDGKDCVFKVPVWED